MRKALIILLVSAAFGFTPTHKSFNSGQVTPLMEARTDFQKYGGSNRTVENMLVKVTGPVERRPGTMYVAAAKGSAEVRLIPFEYSTDDTYILEFYNGLLRFYRDDGE